MRDEDELAQRYDDAHGGLSLPRSPSSMGCDWRPAIVGFARFSGLRWFNPLRAA